MELASDELQLLVLVLVSITSALIGTFFVLRKMTMLANALSHTILPGVVLAYLAYHFFHGTNGHIDFSHLLPSDGYLIAGALLSSFVTTFLTRAIVSALPVAEDASIGMVFTLLFAVGIILVTSLTKSAHIGAELLMGNVDALHYDDLTFMFWIATVNIAILLLSWRPLFATSFDALFAKMCGISNEKVSYLLMAQVAIIAIGAFRAVGVLLFLAFLVTPALIARRFTHKLKNLALASCLIALFASVIGVAFSRHMLSYYELPGSTAGLIVTILALAYGLSLAVIKPVRA
ncbi:MAG: metal ABC transporter permease [Verrucomicrobia bacterium]|nr:metal ABC transporter permease [Verrucomicrobiota bacterium]MBS0638161.1 metal ABC transporter permease [Verrucomicrobiota bacterium]